MDLQASWSSAQKIIPSPNLTGYSDFSLQNPNPNRNRNPNPNPEKWRQSQISEKCEYNACLLPARFFSFLPLPWFLISTSQPHAASVRLVFPPHGSLRPRAAACRAGATAMNLSTKILSGPQHAQRSRSLTIWQRFDRLQRSLRPLRKPHLIRKGLYFGSDRARTRP